jgi:hypothetical protein
MRLQYNRRSETKDSEELTMTVQVGWVETDSTAERNRTASLAARLWIVKKKSDDVDIAQSAQQARGYLMAK